MKKNEYLRGINSSNSKKMQKLIYPLSLLLIAVSVVLIVQYPNSGRIALIAGMLLPLGFVLNIAGYLLIKGRRANA